MCLPRRPGGQVRHGFKRSDKLGAAIGIARIIDGIHADEDASAPVDFRIGQRERKKNGVARGHVGDRECRRRHLRFVAIFGNGDITGQSRAAEGAQIKTDHAMFGRAQLLGDVGGGLHFDLMPLAVIKGEAVTGVAFFARDGEAGGRIEPAAEQADGAFRIGLGQVLV